MAIKTLSGSRTYLESLIPENKANFRVVNLDRMKALLRELDEPQNNYPIIHIGGTAGKGSTATIAAKILEIAGYKTGLHISPHLEDIRERAQVNGMLMSEEEFVYLTNKIKSHVETVKQKGKEGSPTYFEALVAIAFEHFKRAKVDVAVVEVGLGGRLDGTNVVIPKVAVLTNVGLDHIEILGSTVEEIARDKVGIFKQGVDVVSGATQPSVIKIIEHAAREKHCSLDLLGREITYGISSLSIPTTIFDIKLKDREYKNLEISATGEHQIRNAALAIDAVLKLEKCGFNIPESIIRNALQTVSIPARFELVNHNPDVILDGAHNPMKISALVETLRHIYPNRTIRFVFAAKKDKNVEEMIKLLSHISSGFYFTKFQATTDFGKKMSYAPSEMQKFTTTRSQVFGSSYNAYQKAIDDAQDQKDMVCVTGSLYLVGELRSKILRSN